MSVKRSRNTNRAAGLKKPLEKRIRDYSLAAMGTGAVAFAPAASGAVVVTNLNYTLPVNTSYIVTVGGHSVMSVSNSYSSSEQSENVFIAAAGNKFWGPPSPGLREEEPVTLGAPIPGTFPSNTRGRLVFNTTSSIFTAFLNGAKFIGFSFGSGPNINYGWVEFNITQPGGQYHPYVVNVVAAAYETVAGQPLAAGATTDSTPPSTPAPNSLWLIAVGAAGLGGLELLRRRRTA
jgi:MYXO-CTERM domain-containing protein